MSDLALNVYPTAEGARADLVYVNGSDTKTMFAASGSSLLGIRATMIYIHGKKSEWDTDFNRRWLCETAMARLVDNNPARVVWCTDA